MLLLLETDCCSMRGQFSQLPGGDTFLFPFCRPADRDPGKFTVLCRVTALRTAGLGCPGVSMTPFCSFKFCMTVYVITGIFKPGLQRYSLCISAFTSFSCVCFGVSAVLSMRCRLFRPPEKSIVFLGSLPLTCLRH